MTILQWGVPLEGADVDNVVFDSTAEGNADGCIEGVAATARNAGTEGTEGAEEGCDGILFILV